MSVTNPSPIQIANANWDIEPAIRGFTVSIPTRPEDNDLAGIIVLAKAGSGQTLTFPDDVFYKGAWSDLIFVNTDANNNLLSPNQAYTVKVAAFDEFGTDSLTFSNAKETVTLQVVEADIADEAVTNNKIPDEEITSAKISGLVADKITAGTITGSTLQTATSGQRFVASASTNEARFYGNPGNNDYTNLLASIGISPANTVIFENDFSSTNNWTLFGSVSINTSTPVIIYNASSTTYAYYQPVDVFVGDTYTIIVVCTSYTSGTLKCYLGDYASGVDVNGTGSFTTTTAISTDNRITLWTNNFVGEINLVTVKQSSPYVDDCIFRVGTKQTTKTPIVAKGGGTQVIYSENLVAGKYGIYNNLAIRGYGIVSVGTVSSITTTNEVRPISAQLITSSVTGTAALKIANHTAIWGYVSSTGGSAIRGVVQNSSTDSLGTNCVAFSADGDCDFRGGVVYFKSYTVGALPSATVSAGGMIYVSDESGGAVMAFSDGTNWRRVTDRAIVS